MRKTSLRDYLPLVMRKATSQAPGEAQKAIDLADRLIFEAASHGYAELEDHLPTTTNAKVLHLYLRHVGLEMPDVDTDLIRRAFQVHQAYLKQRGTRRGLLLLAWLVTGLEAEVVEEYFESQRLAFGTSLKAKGQRLFSAPAARRTLILKFPQALNNFQTETLQHLLKQDQPVGCKVLIEAKEK